MLASLRAELLVLRKSKVAWALVLTTPMLTLITIYLLWFLEYLGDTPALYAQEGTPAQALEGLLPSQFNIRPSSRSPSQRHSSCSARSSPAETGDGARSRPRCWPGRAGPARSPGKRQPS